MELQIIISSSIISFIVSLFVLFVRLGSYKQKIDIFDSSIKELKNEMKDVNTRVSKIEGGLERDRAYGGIVKAKSPLSLTDKGRRVLQESGAQNYLDKNKSILIKEIEACKPKSSYDVQEFSKQVLDSHKNEDDFIEIKEYVYKNGLVLDHVIMGMAIYLRDYALEIINFIKKTP